MSSVPGPPPPPPSPGTPPPLEMSSVNRKTSLEVGQTETKLVTEGAFIREVVEVMEGPCWGRLYGGEVDMENEVILVVAVPLKTVILQNGPMCGIVALVEALEILCSREQNGKGCNASGNNGVCSKTVLEEAIRRGVTKQGEMFSVKAMQLLAADLNSAKCGSSKILTVSTDDTLESGKNEELFPEMTLHLLSGHPILIPYDADHNHAPSLRQGHAAHWAVLHGLACPVPNSVLCSLLHLDNLSEAPAPPFTLSSFQVLYSSRHLVILKPCHEAGLEEQVDVNAKLIADLFTFQNTHVLAHQGKSFRTALWRYADLLASNQNLREVAPKIMTHREDFVLHEGIEEGLCSKILLLK